jgi:uncharacterized repeat protein (TIGR03803 family)
MKKMYFLITILFLLGIGTVKAQYTQLLNFTGPNGAEPFGSLITNANNTVLYGTAYLGGATHDSGCVFSIHADGSNYRDLLDFNGINGFGPNSPLTLIKGKLFGSANAGGAHDSGLIFSMDTNGGGFKDLFDFSGPNGKNPYNTLVFDSASGILYGVADGGLHHIGCIFSVDTTGGGFRDLYDFTLATGEYPLGLTLVGNKLYGTTLLGGANSDGLVFSVDTSGNGYKDMLDFNNTNGLEPYGVLTYSAGKLYGATAFGGANAYGLLFSIDTNGTAYKDLFDFKNTNGSQPEYAGGALILSGNTLLGTAYNGAAFDSGCIFSIGTNGSGYKDIFDFTGPNGAHPEGSLTLIGATLYGATAFGGPKHEGVIFAFDTSTPKAIAIKDSICKGSTALLYVSGISGASFAWSPGGGTTDSIYVSPASTTTYTVNMTQGITNYTNYLVVTVNPVPTASVTGTSIKCKGKTDTLTASGGTKYLWSNGSTQTTYFTGPINADSTITLVAYNSFGCTDTAHFTITVDTNCPTGINEVQNNKTVIQIFPNPNNGQFTIQLAKSHQLIANSSVEVYNMLGEKIHTAKLNSTSTQINLSNNASGIYLYRVLTETGNLVSEGKFTIQK